MRIGGIVQHLNLCDRNTSHMVDVQRLQQQQNQQIQELLKQQQQQTLALTLPTPEVPVFLGDPIEYSDFVRAFQNLIELKTSSSSTRLYYLIQYTSGDVKELMRSCLSMKPDEGYKTAQALLKSRYGQSYRIATAYVKFLRSKGLCDNCLRPGHMQTLVPKKVIAGFQIAS